MQLLRSRVAWDNNDLVLAESASREAVATARNNGDAAMQARATLMCVRVLQVARKHDDANTLAMAPIAVGNSNVADTFVCLAKAVVFMAQVSHRSHCAFTHTHNYTRAHD